jgi:hypothetical protein
MAAIDGGPDQVCACLRGKRRVRLDKKRHVTAGQLGQDGAGTVTHDRGRNTIQVAQQPPGLGYVAGNDQAHAAQDPPGAECQV